MPPTAVSTLIELLSLDHVQPYVKASALTEGYITGS